MTPVICRVILAFGSAGVGQRERKSPFLNGLTCIFEVTDCDFKRFEVAICDIKPTAKLEEDKRVTESKSLIPVERIEQLVLLIRGHKVLLDEDLADLYGVETRTLNQAVARRRDRFPEDFMFQLSKEEFEVLRSQSVISKGRGGRQTPPYAFTEQGIAMLSSVLNSPRAIQVNIEIMRTFVRLRQMLVSHQDLARKLAALEKKYDSHFKVVFDAIKLLMAPKDLPKKQQIGFRKDDA